MMRFASVCLLLCSEVRAGEPQQFVVVNKTTPTFTVVNKMIPPCNCGCMETGKCGCKNCCERTADPTWTPEQSDTRKGAKTQATLASIPTTYYLINGQWVPAASAQGASPNQFGVSGNPFGAAGGSCANGSCAAPTTTQRRGLLGRWR